jgi:hypothetical protein
VVLEAVLEKVQKLGFEQLVASEGLRSSCEELTALLYTGARCLCQDVAANQDLL